MIVTDKNIFLQNPIVPEPSKKEEKTTYFGSLCEKIKNDEDQMTGCFNSLQAICTRMFEISSPEDYDNGIVSTNFDALYNHYKFRDQFSKHLFSLVSFLSLKIKGDNIDGHDAKIKSKEDILCLMHMDELFHQQFGEIYDLIRMLNDIINPFFLNNEENIDPLNFDTNQYMFTTLYDGNDFLINQLNQLITRYNQIF